MLRAFFLIFIVFNSIISNIYIDELKVYSFKGSHSKEYFYSIEDGEEDDYFGSLNTGIIGGRPDWIVTEKNQDSIYFYNRKDSLLRYELHTGTNDLNRKINMGRNIMYSPHQKNMYYLLSYNQKEERILQSIKFDPYDEQGTLETNPFRITNEYPKSKHSNYINFLDIKYAHISNHRAKKGTAYYLITKDEYDNYMIATNNYNYFTNTNEELWYLYHSRDLNRNLMSKIDKTDLLKYPLEIQTNYTEDDVIQALITFYSEKNKQTNDIYYFCDLDANFESDDGYQIFPRTKDYKYKGVYYPYCYQYQPKFNFDGTKVAFLTQPVNDNQTCPDDQGVSMDLWIFDVEKYYEEMCYDLDYEGDFSGAYTKVDNLVQNMYGMQELDLSMAKDFVWHPTKNIIFYIDNGRRTEAGELNNSIMYYDLDVKKGDIIETNTKRNKYLSISDDGYLTFSFLGLINREASKTNMPYLSSDCTQCNNALVFKIGVAKINIDE